MMKSLATTLCLTITLLMLGAGCSSRITLSSGQTIIVRPAFPDKGIEDALSLAEDECKKRGRSARAPSVTSFNSDIYVFKCVRK